MESKIYHKENNTPVHCIKPMVSSSCLAFSWQMYDFGVGLFDHHNNWSPIDCSRFYADMDPFVPSPGNLDEGGEQFYLEGLHFAMEGNVVHIALVNSFGLSAYSASWKREFALGDIFFGFDGDNTSYAINLDNMMLYEVTDPRGIHNIPGSCYGNPLVSNAVGACRVIAGHTIGEVNPVMTF
ncbi:MAG: hypothetical protein JSV44_05430 [Candidatus Zixiibacteriota bacterium]|nr:MAG: hypothetical protein JSV44_05430 [candidate division Zixibacteria bacterium]